MYMYIYIYIYILKSLIHLTQLQTVGELVDLFDDRGILAFNKFQLVTVFIRIYIYIYIYIYI